jgi:putrescine aminotransferase
MSAKKNGKVAVGTKVRVTVSGRRTDMSDPLHKKVARKRAQLVQKCDLKIRTHYVNGKGERVFTCVSTSREQVLEKARRYRRMIMRKKPLDAGTKRKLIRHTLENFEDFYNRGFVTYRKSVAEAKDFAALEWSGRGSIMRDLLGREYIDCLGGYGIYNMGICHPKIVGAVKAQIDRMPMSSQELLDPLRGELAELLGELAPGDLQESFFISNGTDAVEGALKLARLYTKRVGFISAIKGFHGKSMGSLSVMGKNVYRQPFEPLLPSIHFVPFGDTRAITEEFKKLHTVGQDVAAVILEPVQGEAGGIVPPQDYLSHVKRLCEQYGTLLILDEVQTGLGRCGEVFACEHFNVVPDIMCLGKSLGGGVMPLSAFISKPKIWQVMEDNPFLHTSTFGGNPLACAAGIAAIEVLLEEDLARQAREKGEFLIKELKKLQTEFPEIIKDVHGLGLLLGMDFATNEVGYAVAAGLFHRKVLVAGTLISSKTIRVEPALNIPVELLHKVLDRMHDTLTDVRKKYVRHGKLIPAAQMDKLG